MNYFGFHAIILIGFVMNSTGAPSPDGCDDVAYHRLEFRHLPPLSFKGVDNECKQKGWQLPRLTCDQDYKFLMDALPLDGRVYLAAMRGPNGEWFKPGNMRNEYLEKFNITGNETSKCLIAWKDYLGEGIHLIAQPCESFERVRCLRIIQNPTSSKVWIWIGLAVLLVSVLLLVVFMTVIRRGKCSRITMRPVPSQIPSRATDTTNVVVKEATLRHSESVY